METKTRTIREMIDDYRNKIKDATDLQGEEASRYIVELSSIMGNLNQHLLDTQMEYNKKKLELLGEIKSVAKATVSAETTEEYRAYQEAKGYKDVLVEMIRGLKLYVRAKGDEYGFSKYQ